MAKQGDAPGDIATKLAALTEGQRACLRLVGRMHTSKTIGPLLGISSHAVDDRIRAALRTLAVSSRIEAARLVLEHDDFPPQRLMHQSLGVSAPAATAIDPASPVSFMPIGDGVRNELGEGQATLFAPQLVAGPPNGRSIWDLFSAELTLSLPSRLAIVLAIAVSGVILAALLVTLAEGLSRLA